MSVNAQNMDSLQANRQLQAAQDQLDTLNYEAAIELGKQALATAKQLALPTKTVQALVILGDAHREQGDYDTALTYYQEAKQKAIKVNGLQTPSVAQADNDIGLCYWKKGAIPNAIQFFENALNTRITLFGDQHPKVADSYNNLGNCAFDQRDLNTARSHYEKALNIRLASLEENDPDIASSYNNLGTVYRFAGQFDTAIDYYTKSIKIREVQLGTDHPKVAQSCNNLGQCYEQMGNLEMAIQYFNRSTNILLQHYEEDHPDLAITYLGLGGCYSKSNNHSLALRYFEKALAIQETKFDKDSPNLRAVYNNLANSYKNLGDYNKAMLYYKNNLNLLNNSLGANHPFTAATHNNIGLIQVELVQFEDALKSYRQALSIYEQQQNLPRIADSWNNIGTCFRQQKFFTEAINAYQQSIAIYQQLTGNVSVNKAAAYYNIGNCLGEEGNFEEAINYYKQAINLIEKSNHATLAVYKTSIGQIYYKQGAYTKALTELDASLNLLNITIQDTSQIELIESPIEALNLLNTKAKTLHALAINKNPKTLKEILSITDFSIQLIDQLRQQYQEDYSKRKLSETTYEIIYLGIAACHSLYQESKEETYLQKAFFYSEKSRSNLVLEAIAQQQATASANIPDSLLTLENQLKTAIVELEKQQQTNLQQGVDQEKYSTRLFEKKQAYNELIQQFETDYPSYHQLKYDRAIITVDEVQQELSKEEALLEYFVQDTSIYIFLLKQDAIHLELISVDSLLNEVSLFREGISRYYMDIESQTEYAYQYYLIQYLRSANFLYQKLIAPIEKLLPEKITIVNGGVLNYIPFDALVSKLPEKTVHRLRDIDYLVKTKEINYAYSATLQFQKKNEPTFKEAGKKILALAPTFTIPNRLGLAPLAHTSKEVALIEDIFPDSDVFIGKEATKALFVDQATSYQLLHLATHGKSDSDLGDYSFLAFTDTLVADKTAALLYAKDIYNLSIHADLVVLSACETGTGELARGEGVVSLARAFFYAGATSVITTLWSVNDASTKNIIHYFYQNLNQDLSKGAALRAAKLEYINTADDPNPFFWAAFTLTGKSDRLPLFSSSSSIGRTVLLFALAVFGLIILTFFFEKMVSEDS